MIFLHFLGLSTILALCVESTGTLRSGSAMSLCRRHLRATRDILTHYEHAHIFNGDGSMNGPGLTLMIRKAKLVLALQESAKELVRTECPGVAAGSVFKFVAAATVVPNALVNFSVRLDSGFANRLRAFSDGIETLVVVCEGER